MCRFSNIFGPQNQGGNEVSDDLKSYIAERVKLCDAKGRAYAIWLGRLTPANLLFVVGAALLSLVAGASILQDFDWLTEDQAAIAAFLSSAFTLIHTKLKCDPHQEECRRLRAQYDAMKLRYESIYHERDMAVAERRLFELDEQLAQIVQTAQSWPSDRAEGKATRAVLQSRSASQSTDGPRRA